MDVPHLIQVIRAPRERWGSSLNLVLSHRPFAERVRLAEGLAKTTGGAGFEGLFEAHCEGQVVGAALAVIQPGRTALTYQPRLTPGGPEEAAADLNDAVTQFLLQHDVCLAQEVLPLTALADATRARDFGFTIEVELWYLAADASTFPASPPSGALTVEPYTDDQLVRLAEILSRTYDQTLDCPEINGVRSSIESLCSYRQTGSFNPNNWGILRSNGQDVGCVIIARHEDQSGELIYMGLVPEARGRGWSHEAVDWAKWIARVARCTILSVAADQRNTPALKVYDAAGFVQFDARRVMLRILPPTTASNRH